MYKGDGNWLVVMHFPNLQSKPIGRYRIRSDAEHTKQKLSRLLGGKVLLAVVFVPESDDLQQTSSND